jgi:branched-chain amino acid transport system substrate-binding protein
MTRRTRVRVVGALLALVALAAACSDNKKSNAAASDSGTKSSGAGGAYSVDTSNCPPEATQKITGTVKVGSTMALSGGVAAAAFKPVAAGMKAFFDQANAKQELPGYTIDLTIEDDQYDATKTKPAVDQLIDQTGVNLMTGMVGTPQSLAVRDDLNQECIPQLFVNSGSPSFGDAKNYPWTIGILAPYNTETSIYVDKIKEEYPNGANVAVFYTNNDFGQVYRDTLNSLAPNAKINVVDTQTVEATDDNPPTSQVNSIAGKKPDVIIAAPLGAGCPAFLSELANAKAANPGWNPKVYITSTCASTLILGASGQGADGIYTVVGVKDSNDPKNASDPNVKAYRDAMDASGQDFSQDYATAAAGWTAGEATLAALKQAAASPDGLTRASIMNAVRNFNFHPSLARDGVNLKSSGTADPFLLESLQVVQYNANTKTYTDVGPLITSYEGQTKQPG